MIQTTHQHVSSEAVFTLPKMKVMLQITEKCNLGCAHCFAEANSIGKEMPLKLIKDILLPQFIMQ